MDINMKFAATVCFTDFDDTVRTNAIYVAVIAIDFRGLFLDRLPICRLLVRTLSGKRFKVSSLVVY